MPEPMPIVLVPGLNCSAPLAAAANSRTVAIWAGAGRRPYPRRQHGGDRRRHPGACPAALCARRTFDGRLHRAHDGAAGTRAFQARTARQPRCDRDAGAERAAQAADCARTRRAFRRGPPPLQFPVFVHRNRQHDEALRARVRTMAEETGAEAFLRQQKAIMTRPDMRPLLASIACPTLVLVGDGDELTPPPLSEDMPPASTNRSSVVIADCGHLSTMERP